MYLSALFLAACGSNYAPNTNPVDTGASSDGAWWLQQDVDADGVTTDEGDCDDLNAAAFPGAADDTCDGVDNDCDGVPDQGSLVDEPMPDLGDVTNKSETQILPYLFPNGDEDVIRFFVKDETFGYFDVEVWAYEVPKDVDVKLALYWVEDPNGKDQGLVVQADDLGPGGMEFINHGGSIGPDDGGWYEAVVSATSGSSCSSPIQIQLAIGTL